MTFGSFEKDLQQFSDSALKAEFLIFVLPATSNKLLCPKYSIYVNAITIFLSI